MKNPSLSSPPTVLQPHELALVRDIAEALNEASDISSAMQAILPQMGHVLGLTTAWAFRFDERRSTFVEVGASGLPPALERDNAAALKSSWCECQERLVTGRLDSAINIVHCSRLRDAEGDKKDLEFHASIPLKMDGRPLGILNVAAAGAQVFTPTALDLLRAIGYHVAVTMDRSALLSDIRRHNQQLQSMRAMVRELTGLMQQEAMFNRAVHLLSDQLHYEGVAIIQGQDEVIAKVINGAAGSIREYSYEGHSKLLPENDRLLLDNARSMLTIALPESPYTLRVESSLWNAFSPLDEEILSAFASHLTALLEECQLYAHAMDSVRWSERRQLAANLHDSVSQKLFSAQLLLRSMTNDPDMPVSLVHQSTRVAAIIQQSQSEMRHLILTLRDEQVPLAIEIRHRLLRLKEVLGRRLTWQIEASAQKVFSPPITDGVIRILDEGLQNSLKHAPQSQVKVLYREKEHVALLSIEDDGPGFDPASAPLGVGLSSMQERARWQQLELHIESHPAQGTTILLEIPYGGGTIGS